MIKELKRKLGRKASRAIVGGFRPPESPFTSWFGNVLVAQPQEIWPLNDGKPMMPLCQFNLTELPFRPVRLSDIAFITIFLAGPDELPWHTPNGEGWLLRAYTSLEDLVPLPKPAQAVWEIKKFPIRWELLEEDYPCWEDVAEMELPSEIDENWYDLFKNHDGTKIGGWPSLVQSEIFRAPLNQHPANPDYVFQIDTEPKAQWAWGDRGVGYFGRGTGEHTEEWTLTWQCY